MIGSGAIAVLFVIALIIGIIGAVVLVIGINVGGTPNPPQISIGIALIMLAIILGAIGAFISRG